MKYLLSRILGTVLISTLVIGSLGQTTAVRAAPARGTDILFNFFSLQPTPFICVGDKGEIRVGVWRKLDPSDPKYNGNMLGGTWQHIPGIRIKAAVIDESIGHISSSTQVTTDWNGSADFNFLAENPGETTIKLEATVVTPGWFRMNVGGETISLIIYHFIKVIPCKFKVNTVTKISAGMTSVGIMDGEMRADEQGNFTGTATINWVTNILCGIASPIAPGKADLSGTINDSGQLVGKITFGPMTSVGGGSCGIVSVTTGNFGTLDPITLKASSEGTSVYTQPQSVAATNGSFRGTATVVVIPEEDGAVSSVPGNYEARIGPLFPGWAMQWDDFSSLFGALLALH